MGITLTKTQPFHCHFPCFASLVDNATAKIFGGSELDYHFELVPLGQGIVTAEIPAGIAPDALGNANEAVPSFSRTFQHAKN